MLSGVRLVFEIFQFPDKQELQCHLLTNFNGNDPTKQQLVVAIPDQSNHTEKRKKKTPTKCVALGERAKLDTGPGVERQ